MSGTLQTNLSGYVPRRYHVKKLKRSPETVRVTRDLSIAELDRLIDMYQAHGTEDQTARLLRDSMDHWIRRYHGYCIVDQIGSHYREKGLVGKGILEHVIPLSNVRTLMIEGKLTIEQALNAPMCRISPEKDVMLRQNGLVNSTPDLWCFFKRYQILNIEIEDVSGQSIDIDKRTLQDHYDQFI